MEGLASGKEMKGKESAGTLGMSPNLKFLEANWRSSLEVSRSLMEKSSLPITALFIVLPRDVTFFAYFLCSKECEVVSK